MGAKTWLLLKELRFLQLTLYIIFFLFASPFFGHDWILRLFSSIFLLNALLVSISAGGQTIRIKWLFWIVFGASVIFTALYLLPLLPDKRPLFLKLAAGSDILLLLLCLTVVLTFIFGSREVTLDIIFASVVAYLIIAVTFAHAYFFLLNVVPQSFNLPLLKTPASFGSVHSDMLYYSLIVITTVGIGDIVPLTPIARTLTVLEAMLGQFFVAVLVAWLVGRFISQSSGHRPPPD